MCSTAAFSPQIESTSQSTFEEKNTADENLNENHAYNMGLVLGGVTGQICIKQRAECPVHVYASGKYYRPDLNFPCSLPRRGNGIKDFENDPPLSSCGIFQSRTAGTFAGHSSRNSSNDYH